MRLRALHSLYVEDLSFPVLFEDDGEGAEPEQSDNDRPGKIGGNAKDTNTPAGKALASAGGEAAVGRKSGISKPMLSHIKKPKGHKDHRNLSTGALKRLKDSGVDIKQVVPELFK